MADKKGNEEATVEPHRVQLNTERAVWSRIDDEVVVLDLQKSAYFSVSTTGAFVWSLLEAGTTRGALVESILAEFDIDHATAESDIEAFLGGLSARGLLIET